MKMGRRVIGLMLALVLCYTCLAQISIEINATSASQYTPYAGIEYGYSADVECGTIRYVAQMPKHDAYFFEDYWPEAAFGSYSTPTKECGTASMSMALSYVGVNKTPNDLLTPKNGKTYFISWGDAEVLSYKSTNLETAFEKYAKGNGKYSPPMIHLNKYSTDGHYVLIIGKIDTNTYQVVDPANQKLWEITIDGSVATYNHPNGGAAKTDSLDRSGTTADIYQWYNANASINGYTSYLNKCTAYSTHVTIKTTKTTYIKSLPCSEKTDANSENVEVASAGAQYEAIGLYKNTAGNLWYKVKAKNGSVGYMYAADTVFVSENSSDIVHSGITVPANHTQGNSYKLTGTVSSTYSKITNVSVYIYDAKGNKVTGAEAAVTGNKYSFSGSAIDNKTKFGSLFAGTHTYKVVAFFEYCYADDATTMTTWSVPLSLYEKTFNVVGSSASCSHSYTSKVTTAATCTTAGVKTYTCSKCSDSYTESIAATGHSWNSATCTTAKTCATCGTTSGSALGHSYNSGVITTATTCTTAGVKTYTCSKCSDSYTESIAATGHSWNSATCTTAKTCATCGTTGGSALGHSYNSGVITTATTCTTAGVKTYTCSKCSNSYTESIAATGHSWNSATCTTAKTCATCGTTSGSALGHSYNSGVITTAATCTTAGVKTYTCSKCSDSYTESIAATGHSWNSATCTTAKTCATCGTTSGSALGHSYKTETTPPTCTEQGYTTHTCTACGDSYKDSATNALGHNYSDGICTYCGAEDPHYVTDTNAPQIIVQGTNARRGETVTAAIALKNNPGITSMKLKVTYDPMLTLTGITYNTDVGGQFQMPQTMASPVTLNWVSGTEDAEGDWTYATLTFVITDDAIGGTNAAITVTYDPDDVYDTTETNVAFSIQNGFIAIADYMPGDITNDGKINNKDVTRLLQYLSDWDVEVDEAALDVTGDGKINNKDVTRLLQYLSDWDVEIH